MVQACLPLLWCLGALQQATAPVGETIAPCWWVSAFLAGLELLSSQPMVAHPWNVHLGKKRGIAKAFQTLHWEAHCHARKSPTAVRKRVQN